MIISVTGHRPDKLYGYDLSDKRWQELKNQIKDILKSNNCTEAITGMALGVDTIFALAVLELKDEGYDISLHCAIPCQGHSSKWPSKSKKQYDEILKKADKVVLVSDEPYKPWLMQKRNQYMVDLSEKVIAVFDGTNGGTKNCVDYAKKKNKDIILIEPVK